MNRFKAAARGMALGLAFFGVCAFAQNAQPIQQAKPKQDAAQVEKDGNLRFCYFNGVPYSEGAEVGGKICAQRIPQTRTNLDAPYPFYWARQLNGSILAPGR